MATETKKEPVTKSEDDFKKVDLSLSKFAEPPDVSRIVKEAQPTIGVVGKIMKILKKIFIWVGLVVLIIFLATNKPLREKAVSLFESIRLVSEKEKTEGVFEWWREPHQYGQKRSDVFKNTVITRNDENVFNFELTYFCKKTGRMEKSFFEGEKVSLNRIEGTWSQAYPEDGGHWYLVQDTQNPRLFSGSHSNKTGDNIKCRLRIKLK